MLVSGQKEVYMKTKRSPERIRLPDERQAITHKFKIGSENKGYLTVGLYEDGSPGEIFIRMSKKGATLSALLHSLSISTSMSLQYGVPLKSLVKKFINTKFEPSGRTNNPEIPVAHSITDYIFRWLGKKFLTPEECEELGL
jgi:ribonucleoside-diphosphate reductase alpha chain